MHYSVHEPSPFICTYRSKLLPDWSCPVSSVLIVLQACNCDLLTRTIQTETQKQALRQQFLQLGDRVAARLRAMGYQVEMFDPQTGLPVFSQPGSLRLNDVAVVQACLGYPSINQDGCSIILHPLWGSSVYPSTLLSSATPETVNHVMEEVTLSLPC